MNRHPTDLQLELLDEAKMLKPIFVENCGEETLQTLQLLSVLEKKNFNCLFSNVCVALRIFLAILVTV